MSKVLGIETVKEHTSREYLDITLVELDKLRELVLILVESHCVIPKELCLIGFKRDTALIDLCYDLVNKCDNIICEAYKQIVKQHKRKH